MKPRQQKQTVNICLCTQTPKPMSTTGRTVGPKGGPRKMEVIEKHLNFILSGINSIGLKGDNAVGYLSVFGPTAFPILAAYMEDSPSTRHPIAVASEMGAGKIIAFAHASFLQPVATTKLTGAPIGGLNQPESRDLSRLIVNCCKWVVRENSQRKNQISGQSQGQSESGPTRLCELVNQPKYLCQKGRVKKGPIQNPSILILSSSNSPNSNSNIVPLLKANGMRAELKILEPGKKTICCGDIKNYDVVCTSTTEGFDEDRVKLFTEYVENGGGLVVALTPWAHIYEYKEQIKGNFTQNYPPNGFGRLAGFVWCDVEPLGHAKAWKKEKDTQIFCAHQNLLRNTHVLDLWYEMKHYDIFGKWPPNFPGPIKRQLMAVFNSARRYVHPKDPFWTNEFFTSAARYLKSEEAKTTLKENENKAAGQNRLSKIAT